ncbi:MAG: efflux RND transporter periplasmic adaptor subunit [Bacteroidales bacterium]
MKLNKGLVLLFAVSALFSCKQSAVKEKPVRPVKVSEVKSFSIATNTFSGVVTPDQFSNLAFRTSGPLIAVNVVEGQSVKKGQIIAKMDPRDYQLAYDAKKASYLTAQSQLQRAEKLLSKQAISKQEYESTVAAAENAKSAYENAKQLLDETVLTAPFDGFIQKKFVENYQEVRTGDRVVCLINPAKLQMQATLPETALSYITNNPEIYVEFDSYKGTRFRAKIKEFVQASPDGSGIPIFVTISDPKFNLNTYKVAVGFSCSIELVIKEKSLLDYTIIPISAVSNNPENDKGSVFVYDPQTKKVNRRDVHYGEIINKTKIVVVQGLTPGELVVTAGANRVTDGEEVNLLND